MKKKFPERERSIATRGFHTDGNRVVVSWRELQGEKKMHYSGINAEFPDGFLIDGVTEEGDAGVIQAFDMFDAKLEKVKREVAPPRIVRATTIPRGNGRGKRKMS